MLIFGFSKKKKILDAVEESSTPTMTVLPRPEELKGTSYRIIFNQAARDIMGDNAWTIGQNIDENHQITHFIARADALPAGTATDFTFTVYNNGHLNHMKFWKHLKSAFNVKYEDELKLQYDDTTFDGLNVVKLTVATEDFSNVSVEDDVHIPEDDIAHESFFGFDENNSFEELAENVVEDTDDSFTFNP